MAVGRHKRYRAAFSVEAVLIMPLIIFVILLLTEYIMVSHDRVVAKALIYQVCSEAKNEADGMTENGYDFAALATGRMFFKDMSALEEQNAKKIKKRAEESLLFSEMWQLQVKCDAVSVRSSAYLKHKQIVPFLSRLIGKNNTKIEMSVNRYDRENKTRLSDIILQTIGPYIAPAN